MKLAIGILSFLVTIPAIAGGIDCRRGVDHKHPACYVYPHATYHNHQGPVVVYKNNDWVTPAIIGAVGAAIIIESNNRRNEPRVIVQQMPTLPTVQTQTCTPWVEIQNSDGTVYRQRTCN